jgi:predicted metal-dependent HD superfamily phosphohydrolase
MLNKQEMQNFVLGLFKSKLSGFYYFHNAHHTLYVIDRATEIAQHEKCTEAEIDLIKTASLWHDAGYINIYYGHEEESCALAKKHLPDYGYSNEEINIICGIIMATKTPQSPKNLLEEIVADADLEYLGTSASGKTAMLLFKELKHLNPQLTEQQWNETQINFLKNHTYFTNYCKTTSEPVKQVYLKRLMDGLH